MRNPNLFGFSLLESISFFFFLLLLLLLVSSFLSFPSFSIFFNLLSKGSVLGKSEKETKKNGKRQIVQMLADIREEFGYVHSHMNVASYHGRSPIIFVG
jgi:hypothetical protein